MANFVYTPAKTGIANGTINLSTDDIRVLLVGLATTADTQEDAATISAFTTLDELTGGNYVRKTLTGEVINEDLVNNRAEFDAADVTWTALGPTTPADAAAAVVFKFVTTDADSIPLVFIDTGGFPFPPNGGDVTLQWNAEGILQLT